MRSTTVASTDSERVAKSLRIYILDAPTRCQWCRVSLVSPLYWRERLQDSRSIGAGFLTPVQNRGRGSAGSLGACGWMVAP